VLDPFCGSATTGVSAVMRGRKFIGIDSDQNYLDTYAIPRIFDAESEFLTPTIKP
jgi:DNA modification methylase